MFIHRCSFVGLSSRLQPLLNRKLATEGQYVPIGKRYLNGKSFIIVSATAAAIGTYYMYQNDMGSLEERKNKAAPLGSLEMTPSEFRAFRLKSIKQISSDTSIFRFELPDKDSGLDMKPSSFVLTRAPNNQHQPGANVSATAAAAESEPVIRPYTPISLKSDKGFFELLVKRYKDGPMSSHIFSLKKDDLLEIKGPILKFDLSKTEPHDHFAMIAGGTGITPMYQMITAMFDKKNKMIKENEDIKNPLQAPPKVTLFFGNISENDILLKKELDSLAEENPDKLKIVYLIDKPSTTTPSSWSGVTGYITKELLKKYLPSPKSGKIKVFICGPSPMVSAICGSKAPDYSQGELKGFLKDLGYTPDQVFKF